jgi:hypothetical protein
MVDELLVAARGSNSFPVLHNANFSGVVFEEEVSFAATRFVGYADFSKSTFAARAYFSGAEFEGNANFGRAVFNGETFFENLKPSPERVLQFSGARFAKYCSFGPLHHRQVDFNRCQFADIAMFLDLRVGSYFNIINARFSEPVWHFNAGCKLLCLRRTRFERGATLHLHGGNVDLEGAEFLSPSLVLGGRTSGQFLAENVSLVMDGGSWQPRLVSIAGVDSSHLVLSDVDASHCVFRGALHLDGLRFATPCPMDHPPRGLCAGTIFPFVWWWSDRMTVREERDWRAEGARPSGWRTKPAADEFADPTADGKEEKPSHRAEAERLAKIYRALRKGCEDEKNEPGAGDFYYGEMEMRRHGLASASERLLLWLYWVLSGYSLRPLRTLAALAVLWLVSAALLFKTGFANPGEFTFLQALQISMASTVNLDVVKNEVFSFAGQWLRFPLRILGPLFFGLLLLAIRGRVRR